MTTQRITIDANTSEADCNRVYTQARREADRRKRLILLEQYIISALIFSLGMIAVYVLAIIGVMLIAGAGQ